MTRKKDFDNLIALGGDSSKMNAWNRYCENRFIVKGVAIVCSVVIVLILTLGLNGYRNSFKFSCPVGTAYVRTPTGQSFCTSYTINVEPSK